MLSIIIPLSQQASDNERILRSLKPLPREWELLLAGPFEEELAHKYDARYVETPRERGVQKGKAAALAQGEWLLFLHPGVVLSAGWKESVQKHMLQSPAHPAQFTYKVNEDSENARQVEQFMQWRMRNWVGSGAQGLLVSRASYDKAGGFKPWPICEDLELLRTLKKQETVELLPVQALLPAETFQRGYMRTALFKAFVLYLYFLNIPPSLIARWCRAEI